MYIYVRVHVVSVFIHVHDTKPLLRVSLSPLQYKGGDGAKLGDIAISK